jgi:TetR/AcrR family transcriptional repressor of nem operon
VAPPKRTREATKQETREALIQAGMELFGEEGLDTPSLDAICERAGFTRGAFYVHFRDRDDFLEAVMDRVGASFLDAVLGSGDATADLGAIVERFIGTMVSGSYPLTREGGVRPHQLLDACVRSPAIRARYVALVEDTLLRLGKLVSGGQKTGMLRADVDAAQIASILLAAVIGAQTMIELRVPVDLARAAEAVLAMVRAPAPGDPPSHPRQVRPRKAKRGS